MTPVFAPHYVVAMFDGRQQKYVTHYNRRLYEKPSTAKQVLTNRLDARDSGKILIVDLNVCDTLGTMQDLDGQFARAEERMLFWGSEIERLDGIIKGRTGPFEGSR